MSAHAELLDHPALDLPHVWADLHYLGRMTERPRNYTFDPPPGVPRSNIVSETHRVPIHDLRPIEAEISLDREGFELLGHVSAVRDFYNEDEVRSIYYPESERLIAEATGASRVFIFDHTVRLGSRRHGCTSITPRSPGPSGCVTCWATKPRNC
jgi:hypothetical protein